MQADQLIQQIKKDLENEDLKIIFARLKNAIKQNSSSEKQYLILKSRYNSHTKHFMNGTIAYTDYQLEMNRLVDTILDFIEQVSSQDIVSGSSISLPHITNPILVVCFSREDADIMQAFFALLDFENVSVHLDQEIDQLNLTDYELVVFDNHRLPNANNPQLNKTQIKELDQRSDLMKKYLDQNNDYSMIHYGEYLPFVSEHRERVHAANSRFTLYARVKEVLEFRERFISE